MRVVDIVRFLGSIDIEVSYCNIMLYSKGKKLSWEASYYLSKKFPVKDTMEWRNSKIENLIELIIPYYNNIKTNTSKLPIGNYYIAKTTRQKRVGKLKRIREKYGIEIFKDFKTIKNVPFHTLTWLSAKYEFSREYARQLYEFIYNRKYKDSLKAKNLKLKEIQCANNPTRKVADWKKGTILYQSALAEKLFMDKCLALGFNISIPCDNRVDIIVNNYMVDVKSSQTAFKTSKVAKVKYHRYQISPDQRSLCHFFALYNIQKGCFYIIPNKERGCFFKKFRSIHISKNQSTNPRAKNKYHELKERFDLLATRKE